MVMLWYNKTTLYPTSIWTAVRPGTPAVRNLYAQEASCNGDAVVRRDNVIPNINMDGGTTGTPAACNLYAQKASRNGDAVVRQDNIVPNINMDGGTTGTPAVRNLHAREASRDGDAVVRQDNVIPNINMDIRRPGYPEAQHHSIEDGAADADAMDIDDTVNDDPIGLQIEAGASDKTAKALWLVGTCTPIGGEATASTSISIKELKRAICVKQSHDSLV
ncbi:MAG: hypothetical protein FRX48_03403 [Lasallia pustulata]|uniref:Uncharacterized protein n=1 Tax=Lasallia pustulata TaxID=136370 RepID=A0A5M8PUQ0_9LECA|nr:MAG: hypothetical protein FRX48_03403 [Lasallia pustulata]